MFTAQQLATRELLTDRVPFDWPRSQLVLYDAAGEDFRFSTRTALSKNLPAAVRTRPPHEGTMHLVLHREQLLHADVIPYLLERESLFGAKDSHAQNEACWLLKAFVSHPHWRNRRRLVARTEQDEHECLLADYRNDIC